ncbi:breast cancer type 2 susceptibility protein homolog [Protopterus annectens]|uniref:breast cancer type 2 susceptibility protein homolog n=1 Tax=Protopterus annectens TaxID=7888 RepID=UPI001CFB851B|nr:breast cancer type 2 susceptibility protein homolog [Protopterus annectens]
MGKGRKQTQGRKQEAEREDELGEENSVEEEKYMEGKIRLYTCGGSKSTVNISGENAESYQFVCQEFFCSDVFKAGHGAQLADGGWLIPSNEGMAGKQEFYRALCDTPGVDPALISEAWVYNHYRWIVWKLAAMEVSFPQEFGSRCLTPERVLLQLKYRYDVEIDHSLRSAIRKIMERDDTAAKTVVLCVSRIVSVVPKSSDSTSILESTTAVKTDSKALLTKKDCSLAVVEVTDGWYSIKALLDPPLTALLHRGRLAVGYKIIVHGAELLGSQDACTPLEASDSVMLKISANSCRLARWHTKLGFFHDPRPFALKLSSLFGDGGTVGCVDVVILRLYPMQWMEKKADGIYIFRNSRAEEKEAQKQEERQQQNMEKLFAKIRAEFEQKSEAASQGKDKKMLNLTRRQIQSLQDGADLYEAIQNASDPSYLEACLTEEQLRMLNNHRQMVKDKKQVEIQAEFRKALESAEHDNQCSKRDVTPVWKMRVAEYKKQMNYAEYILNIWRPPPDLHSLLKEGARYRIYHVTTSQCRGRAGIADVQLTATKKTQFQLLQPSQSLTQLFSPRQALKFADLLYPDFQPPCMEIDLVGYIISFEAKPGAAPVVYLCDEGQDLLAVRFWTGLTHLALEDVIKPFSVIAACNLQWRSDCKSVIPTLYAGELSSFSINPKEGHLKETCTTLRNVIQSSGIGRKSQTPLSLMKPGFRNLSTSDSAQNFFQSMKKEEREVESATKLKKMRGMDYLSRIPSPPHLNALKSLVSPSLQKAFHPPRSTDANDISKLRRLSTSKEHISCTETSERQLPLSEEEWVADEELAMINTQALLSGASENVNMVVKERSKLNVSECNNAKSKTALVNEQNTNQVDVSLNSPRNIEQPTAKASENNADKVIASLGNTQVIHTSEKEQQNEESAPIRKRLQRKRRQKRS